MLDFGQNSEYNYLFFGKIEDANKLDLTVM